METMRVHRVKSTIYNVVTGLIPGSGRFVEFGGYDGDTHSISSILIKKKGWSGYFTEPIPESFNLCAKLYSARPDIIVDSVAIGECDGWLEMSISGLISSGSPGFREHSKNGGFEHLITGKSIRVKVLTLDHFFEKHAICDVDLLVVDVEGMEWEVFKGFDIDRWHPAIIMVEIHRKLMDVDGVGDQYKRVEEHLLDRGYEIVFRTGVNTLFYGG